MQHSENIYGSLFNHNYSSSALLGYLTNIYQTEQNPEKYLKSHPLPFHWGDWLDLSLGSPFSKSYRSMLKMPLFGNDEAKFKSFMYQTCYGELLEEKKTLNDNEHTRMKTANDKLQDVAICGSIFLNYYWTIPERILIESDYKYFNVPIDQKRLPEPLGIKGLSKLHQSMPEEFIKTSHKREEQLDKLLGAYKKALVLIN